MQVHVRTHTAQNSETKLTEFVLLMIREEIKLLSLEGSPDLFDYDI